MLALPQSRRWSPHGRAATRAARTAPQSHSRAGTWLSRDVPPRVQHTARGGAPAAPRGRPEMAAGAGQDGGGRAVLLHRGPRPRALPGAGGARAARRYWGESGAACGRTPPHRGGGGGELLSADRKLVSVCVCVSAYFPKVDYVLGKVFFTTAAEPGELKELKSGERLFLLLKKCVPLSVSRNKGTARCSALEAPTLTETAQVGTVCPPVCFHVLSCAENGLKMALNICPSCWHGGACSLWHWAACGLQLWGPHPTMVISFEMGIFKHVFP